MELMAKPQLTRRALERRLEQLSDRGTGAFLFLARQGACDLSRPLLVLVHPGDAIEKPDDVAHLAEDAAERVLAYSLACQEGMGREILALAAEVDLAVLHRPSSHYQLQDRDGVAPTYAQAIALVNERGAVAWGDDLAAAANWLEKMLGASRRPLVVLTGAWSDADTGCIAALGSALEKADAKVQVSAHASISPGAHGRASQPAAGSFAEL